jgi:hypothetical protein
MDPVVCLRSSLGKPRAGGIRGNRRIRLTIDHEPAIFRG